MGASNDRRRGPGIAPRPFLFTAHDERGVSLVELVVAMGVLGVIMSGLALSLSVDYKAIALTRTRQVAEAAASRELEEFRDIDYSALALLTQPEHNSDSSDPDFFVSKDGAQYDVTGTGQNEDLIVAPKIGPVSHLESDVKIGETQMDIYRYVTWVDVKSVPGTHDLKRLSVVARYRATPAGGTTRILRESVLLTPGTVSVGASIITTTTSTTTTTLPPTTTTTTPVTTCGSFTIAGASPATAGFSATTSTTITMSLGSCGSNVIVNFSNDGGQTWGPDFSYGTLKKTSWLLTNGDGKKTVSGRIRNGAAGAPKSLAAKTITLDATPPTTPGSFSKTASCSGSNRTVVLTWSPASDANLVGYRVYRSTNGTTYSLLATTATTTASNKHSKSLTSVSFYVIAYDKSGNVSNATSTIILAKNQCS